MNFRDSPLRRKAPSIDYRDPRPRKALLLATPLVLGIVVGLLVGRVTSRSAPAARVSAPLAGSEAVAKAELATESPAGGGTPSGRGGSGAPLVATAGEAEMPTAADATEAAFTAIAPTGPIRAKHHAASGEYANGAVKNVILRNASDIRTCYESYLEAGPAVDEGKITIDWQIDADGKVVKPAVVTSDLDGESLVDCLVARFAGFEFPPPPDRRKTYAVHTFVFRREL